MLCMRTEPQWCMNHSLLHTTHTHTLAGVLSSTCHLELHLILSVGVLLWRWRWRWRWQAEQLCERFRNEVAPTIGMQTVVNLDVCICYKYRNH